MRWFKPAGPAFIPVSTAGWLITNLAIAFCGQVFRFVDARSHSVGDTLYDLFPFWAPTLLALGWLADSNRRSYFTALVDTICQLWVG